MAKQDVERSQVEAMHQLTRTKNQLILLNPNDIKLAIDIHGPNDNVWRYFVQYCSVFETLPNISRYCQNEIIHVV